LPRRFAPRNDNEILKPFDMLKTTQVQDDTKLQKTPSLEGEEILDVIAQE